MKDLEKMAAECTKDLLSIGIHPRTVAKWTVNTRAKNRWGSCKMLSPGIFEISISWRLLQDDVDEMATKNTIVHELLHTVNDCYNHKGKWKQLAEKVNNRLPQYKISRVTSCEEKGIQEEDKPLKVNYILECNRCGYQIQRERCSRIIQHPEYYRCGYCGGEIRRLK